MTKKVTLIRIFVASPGDVKIERESLEQVINDLNITLVKSRNIVLELVKWETHAYSSIGDDGQQVINKQINNEYDIFIGILWQRFGTKTPREKSGTLEEFKLAYDRFKKDPDSIRVMFYFNEALISPKDSDAKQLLLIQRFRNKLPKMGVLHWSYNELDDFIRIVRIHISQHIQEFGESWGLGTKSPQTKIVTNGENKKEIQEFDEEEGYLDLIEIGTESFEKTTEITHQITQIILDLTGNISSGAKDLANLEQPINPKQAKRILNRTAEDLEHFASRMRAEVPKLSEYFNRGISSYGRIAELWTDFNIENNSQIVDAIKIIANYSTSLKTIKKSANEFRENISKWPRVTTKLNHAKRNSIAATGEFIDELTRYINLTNVVKISMKKIVKAD